MNTKKHSEMCLLLNKRKRTKDERGPKLSSVIKDLLKKWRMNGKVSNHGSIPITIDCNVVAFVVFEEGFHQPIKRTKQSVFLDVTVFRLTLGD
ncbi:hypothetical protein TNCV_4909141 [Trichonephila clavipes]|uniref:Uncharacterized protein n=1 Tax=Trichonephila clavipes TaxID=2585209 RepID=A0A8X6RVI9_TRICX|nr:hypothetical protein TNCV_4909141 [Trichonephila clavipes]